MFNDKYGLTDAVLTGRKTQTRRVITCPKTCHGIEVRGFNVWRRASDGLIGEICMFDDDEFSIDGGQILPKYKVGEIVAIAQSYKDSDINFIPIDESKFAKNEKQGQHGNTKSMKGYNNKMFVRADLMPHQIRITNVRVQKLQEISDEDCLKEGVGVSATDNRIGYPLGIPFKYFFGEDKPACRYATPREAYAALIDKVSGKGTWESNPYVFVYDFELVK